MMSDTFDQTYAGLLRRAAGADRGPHRGRLRACRQGRLRGEPRGRLKDGGHGELLAAWRAGWRRFAENRPQELTRKLAFVEQTPEMAGAAFDLIGNLQKNKINQVVGKVGLIHSISSAELARQVSERSERHGAASDVLLEVNVSARHPSRLLA